jgi:hypothetical protein
VTERIDRQGGEFPDLVKQIAAVDTVSRAPHIRAPRSNGAHSNFVMPCVLLFYDL